jgi:hypothetical protein
LLQFFSFFDVGFSCARPANYTLALAGLATAMPTGKTATLEFIFT